MAVKDTNELALLMQVGENPYVILKYHSDECSEVCAKIINIFHQLSDEPQYKPILFLRIETEGNLAVKEFLLSKKTCIVAIYYKGRMLDSCYVDTKEQVERLLDKLLIEK